MLFSCTAFVMILSARQSSPFGRADPAMLCLAGGVLDLSADSLYARTPEQDTADSARDCS